MPDEKDEAQEKLQTLPVKAGQRYRHFKGEHEVEIMAVGLHENTLEPVVVYLNPSKGTLWVRTAENFLELVERDGKKMKRFQLITPTVQY